MGGKVSYFKITRGIQFMFWEKWKSSIIGDNLRTDVKGANNLKLDCIFITDGVHRDEISKISDLEKLSKHMMLKSTFFQKELTGDMKIYNNANLNKRHLKVYLQLEILMEFIRSSEIDIRSKKALKNTYLLV